MPDSSAGKQYQLLTDNQDQVLRYIRMHPNGISYRIVEQGTGLPYCTVRNCIGALEKYKIIKAPEKERVGRSIRMNIEFVEAAYIVDDPTDEQKEACIKNKAQEILDTHAEFGYWREKGLTAQQIHQWHAEFGAKYEALQLSLRWCAFDMIYNNVELEKKIKSPINWLYSILKSSGGFYPKPQNYKTADERMTEMLEERAKEKAAIAERLRLARIRDALLDHEIAFEKMMIEPDGEMYKKCFGTLSDSLQKRYSGKKTKTVMFAKLMRKAYAEINGVEGFDDPNLWKEEK